MTKHIYIHGLGRDLERDYHCTIEKYFDQKGYESFSCYFRKSEGENKVFILDNTMELFNTEIGDHEYIDEYEYFTEDELNFIEKLVSFYIKEECDEA